MEKVRTFNEVYSIDVSEYIEKKGQLSYLSWARAWAEFKKMYPDAIYKVEQFNGTFCSGNEKIGYMVRTEVTADGLTYEMWLPVMDSRNQTILQPKMTEVNKTIMRCLTKNLAMFGLGLYIYAGEDLPEGEENETVSKTEIVKKNQNINADNYVISFGKYRGKTLAEIFDENSDYVKWLSENANNDDIREAAKYIIEKNEKSTELKQEEINMQEIDEDLPF